MSELLDLYEDYLRTEKKASANTISSYLRDMHQFEATMLEQELELTEVLTQEVALRRRADPEGPLRCHGDPLHRIHQILLQLHDRPGDHGPQPG